MSLHAYKNCDILTNKNKNCTVPLHQTYVSEQEYFLVLHRHQNVCIQRLP